MRGCGDDSSASSTSQTGADAPWVELGEGPGAGNANQHNGKPLADDPAEALRANAVEEDVEERAAMIRGGHITMV